jgi:peptidoglycan/LPS O-acetylase OafA/YrhL
VTQATDASDRAVDQAGERRSARIESLRALAALGVLVGHVYGWTHYYRPEVYQSVTGRFLLGGGFGVTLFFTLSGYLLTLPLARAFLSDSGTVSLPTYAMNRALRVLPLYYVVIGFFLVVSPDGQRHHWWRYALLMESFYPDSVTRIDGPVWSLLIEVQFYALLPLVVYLLGRLSRGSLVAATGLVLLLGAALLAVRILTVNTAHPTPVWRYSLPAWAVFFIQGLLLALAKIQCERQPPSWLVHGWLSRPLVWVTPSIALLAVVLYRYKLDSLLLPAWFLLVGACVLPLGSDRGLRWLTWTPLSLVGVCSYSLYLWHEPLVYHLRVASWAPAGFGPQLALALPLALLVAFVSYRLVEAPFLRLRRQWKPEPAPAPPG